VRLVDNVQGKQVSLTFPEIHSGQIGANTAQYFWWQVARNSGEFRFLKFWDEDAS
jgi:hypothetical protein